MPCSDLEARNFMDDHRVRRMDNEIDSLQKQVKKLKETPSQKELDSLKEKSFLLADKLNKTTELLCSATWMLNKKHYLTSELQEWYDEHTKEDIERMKSEFGKIKTVAGFLKWMGSLNEKENHLLATEDYFKKHKWK